MQHQHPVIERSELSRENEKEAKRESIDSINRRILSLSCNLVVSNGFTVEIEKWKRESNHTFPYFIIKKIISSVGVIIFDYDELYDYLIERVVHKRKQQFITNCIKRSLNNTLYDIYVELNYQLRTKTSSKLTKDNSQFLDNRTMIKITDVSKNNNHCDMKDIEYTIGDESYAFLGNVFNQLNVKSVTLCKSETNQLMAKYVEDGEEKIFILFSNPFVELFNLFGVDSTINNYAVDSFCDSVSSYSQTTKATDTF